MMNALADQYKQSIKLLDVRLKELNKIKLKLQSASEDPKKVIEIQTRIKTIFAMKIYLVEIEKEVRNYYKPGWYRSPDYTMNVGKGRKFKGLRF